MTKYVLALIFVLVTSCYAGPMVGIEDAGFLPTDYDTVSVDLSSVPMDAIEVIPQSSLPDHPGTLGEAIAAAVIAAPEPSTGTAVAVSLLITGVLRGRKRTEPRP